MTQVVNHKVLVPAGMASALVMVNGLDDDEFAILYSPDAAVTPTAPYMEGGSAVVLTTKTSPLLLTLPGVYALSPNADLSDNVEVQGSPNPFPIALTRSV